MHRIWHDDAMRALPLWLTLTALNTSVFLGLLFFRQAAATRSLHPPTSLLLSVLWLAIALYLLLGRVRTRCQRLEMTLPIPARRLWRRHFTAVVFAGTLVLAASLGVLALHAALLVKTPRGGSLEIPILPLVGPLMAGLLLAATLIDSVAPGLWKLRGNRSYWALSIGSLAGTLALLLLLHRWPWILIAICLVLAFIVGRRTLSSLPAAYRLEPETAAPAAARRPLTSESADGQDAEWAPTSARAVSSWQIYRILFNVLHNAPPWKQFAPWMLYSFVALIGFVLAGGLSRWVESQDLRFVYIPMGSYMLFAGMGLITYHLFRLDPLPVSRRVLFAVLTLPSMIVYCVGFSAGRFAVATAPEAPPGVDYRVEPPYAWVEIDPAFMGVAFDGTAPILTSPWGESHEAWHASLFPGSSAILHHPFSTAEETTAGFEALMTSRALEAVYGATIPPEEIRQRYFVVEDDRVVGLQAGGFTLLEDYPDLQAPPGGPETPVYMVLVMVPFLLLMALFVRSFKARSSVKYIRGVYWVGLALLMVALLGQIALAVVRLFNPAAARAFLAVFIHRLAASPTTWLAAWVVSLALIAACYWLALAQFKRAEIPASPINCSLVDWGKED